MKQAKPANQVQISAKVAHFYIKLLYFGKV